MVAGRFLRINALAAALAAPAVLFLGAGAAHADIFVQANSAPGGVDVTVSSWAGGSPSIGGWCTYTSTVQGNPIGKPVPAINVPFFLGPLAGQPGNQARLWFPSYPTGSTWDISVTCPGPGGGESRITENSTVVW